jgi:hypothetical protein
MRFSAGRGTALVAALVLIAGALIAVQLAAAKPAAAVPGLIRIQGDVSATDPAPAKTVRANCPAGLRVVGGGGWAFNTTRVDEAKVALTALVPVHPATGVDYYEVSGQAVNRSTNSNWWLQAWALCANPIDGLSIQPVTSGAKAADVQAICPAGQAPIGGGGRVNTPAGHVSLQGVSANGARVVTWAAPDTAAYTGTWTLTSYAICARPLAGANDVQAKSTGAADAPVKAVTNFSGCAPGTRVHGVFGGIERPTRPGLVLSKFFPEGSLNSVGIGASDTQSPVTDWRPVVALSHCAN